MKYYQLTNQVLLLPTTNDTKLRLLLTQNSGKIVYRNKINTLIGIKHPGIELGTDEWGNRWILHHHYKNVKPAIDKEDVFSDGASIFYDDREVFYNNYEIIERGLASWGEGAEYHWLWQNCQHFINKVAFDNHKSEAIDEISDGAMALGGIVSLIGLFTKSKGLVNTGLVIAGGGLTTKVLNKYPSTSNHRLGSGNL